MNLLEKYPHSKLPIREILHCWNHGSVVRSWLVELMEQAYALNGGLADVPSFVEDTGEVNWLISDALHMEVPVPAMATAVMQLFSSRDEDKKWARAIAMIRHGFGGHPYGHTANIARERQTGRVVDDFLRSPAS